MEEEAKSAGILELGIAPGRLVPKPGVVVEIVELASFRLGGKLSFSVGSLEFGELKEGGLDRDGIRDGGALIEVELPGGISIGDGCNVPLDGPGAVDDALAAGLKAPNGELGELPKEEKPLLGLELKESKPLAPLDEPADTNGPDGPETSGMVWSILTILSSSGFRGVSVPSNAT